MTRIDRPADQASPYTRIRMLRRLALVALLAVAAGPAGAQYLSRYEAEYGPPIDVSLTDLAMNPESYDGRAVRTSGRLDLGSGLGSYVLRDLGSAGVDLLPVPEVSGDMDGLLRELLGKRVQVVGGFRANRSAASSGALSHGVLRFWRLLGPPDKSQAGLDKVPPLPLERLVAEPGRRDGQLVRVSGQFRGRNLYGDLPARSQLDHDDWVIKDELSAVWVTGRKPKGDGFALDASLKRDTGKWLEVVGRVTTRGGVTYVEASAVGLGRAPLVAPSPEPAATAAPERPVLPPEIVFSLPLDGERDVAPDGSFTVQFSRDMDVASFDGRVQFRYAGAPRPGDRGFDGIRFVYDDGRRALTVLPGDRLQPGRTIELLFLEGIRDLQGQPLRARPGRVYESAVDILRWQARAIF